jgi:hypothetical protein
MHFQEKSKGFKQSYQQGIVISSGLLYGLCVTQQIGPIKFNISKIEFQHLLKK